MKRLFYVDNLRIFLISLVVLHHLAITYGGPGGWYYVENEPDSFSIFPFTLFLASNQSFFMGMFYMISAYFTAMSLSNKNTGKFISDRLIRLGIPLLIFYFIINPLTIFVLLRFAHGEDIRLIPWFLEHHGFGFGPMWFVEVLLIFTFGYVLYNAIFLGKNSISKSEKKFPKGYQIILAALILGVINFMIRTKLHLGWEIKHTGIQIPFFTPYVFLFIIGIVAYRKNWLDTITYSIGIRWFLFAQIMILIIFPLNMIFGLGSSGELDAFTGGWTWQSLSYSLWEPVTGFSLIIGLTGIFKKKLNSQNKLARQMSLSAYTVYVIHPLVLVSIGAFFKNFELYHFIKFIILAPVALIVCFVFASLIRRIPYVNKVM